jgi:hypothetical protein
VNRHSVFLHQLGHLNKALAKPGPHCLENFQEESIIIANANTKIFQDSSFLSTFSLVHPSIKKKHDLCSTVVYARGMSCNILCFLSKIADV